MQNKHYDLIVIGGGAAGILAAISAGTLGKKVLLLEKLPQIASKLKATGGGRCNLSNTLPNSDFMGHFGRNGRFMTTALELLSHQELITFFDKIGVKTHMPDGFRIFPTTHNSSTIINALTDKLNQLNIEIICNSSVNEIVVTNSKVSGVKIQNETFSCKNVAITTGGLGYPKLGSTGDGHTLSSNLGHTITSLHPAMMPLFTKENWGNLCRADTIAKAIITIDIPKAKNLKAIGDLIFTSNGIRGPVVLDFAREITPFLDKYNEVPIYINMVKGKNESDILQHFKKQNSINPHNNIVELLTTLLPNSVALQLALLADTDISKTFNKQDGLVRANLVKIVANTPLTVIGHDGFKMAMITRGGISLKQIDPKTMQSKIISNLYFAGEIVNLDGPCGGYNLQWAFSSGYLAGMTRK